jgi:hypothetical protein
VVDLEDGACSRHGGEKCIPGFDRKTYRPKRRWECMDWLRVDQDGDKWQMRTVVKFKFHEMCEIS